MGDIPRKSGIYQIRNLVNGKVYVGSAVNLQHGRREHRSDLRNGNHHSIKLQRAYNKYGESSFAFEILEYVEDRNQLIEREQYYIDTLHAVNEGYNINKIAGSRLGMRHSEATKALFKEQRKYISEETRQKLSRAGKGKHLSESHKAKLSIARKGKCAQKVQCIELNITFNSLPEASQYIGKSVTAVWACCHGKQKTLSGYHWKYVD